MAMPEMPRDDSWGPNREEPPYPLNENQDYPSDSEPHESGDASSEITPPADRGENEDNVVEVNFGGGGDGGDGPHDGPALPEEFLLDPRFKEPDFGEIAGMGPTPIEERPMLRPVEGADEAGTHGGEHHETASEEDPDLRAIDIPEDAIAVFSDEAHPRSDLLDEASDAITEPYYTDWAELPGSSPDRPDEEFSDRPSYYVDPDQRLVVRVRDVGSDDNNRRTSDIQVARNHEIRNALAASGIDAVAQEAGFEAVDAVMPLVQAFDERVNKEVVAYPYTEGRQPVQPEPLEQETNPDALVAHMVAEEYAAVERITDRIVTELSNRGVDVQDLSPKHTLIEETPTGGRVLHIRGLEDGVDILRPGETIHTVGLGEPNAGMDSAIPHEDTPHVGAVVANTFVAGRRALEGGDTLSPAYYANVYGGAAVVFTNARTQMAGLLHISQGDLADGIQTQLLVEHNLDIVPTLKEPGTRAFVFGDSNRPEIADGLVGILQDTGVGNVRPIGGDGRHVQVNTATGEVAAYNDRRMQTFSSLSDNSTENQNDE